MADGGSPGDLLKRFWWVAALLAGFVALWILLPFGPAGDSPGTGADSGLQAGEQSLDSLDSIQNPSGAPGAPLLPMEGMGAYRRRTADGFVGSSLYQPPPAGQSASTAAAASPAAGGAGALAAALKAAARGRRAGADGGWGGEGARSGFAPPKARFSGMSGLSGGGGGGGGGGSMASASYGAAGSLGSFEGGSAEAGAAAAAGRGGGGFLVRRRPGGGTAMNALRGAEDLAARAAASGLADRSLMLGGRTYDATGNRAPISLGAGQGGAGAAAVLGSLDAVPDNLKANDSTLQRRELKPPEIPKTRNTEQSRFEFEKMMTQMIIQAAIGGIMGPIFGGVGAGLAGSLGMNYNSGVTMTDSTGATWRKM